MQLVNIRILFLIAKSILFLFLFRNYRNVRKIINDYPRNLQDNYVPIALSSGFQKGLNFMRSLQTLANYYRIVFVNFKIRYIEEI